MRLAVALLLVGLFACALAKATHPKGAAKAEMWGNQGGFGDDDEWGQGQYPGQQGDQRGWGGWARGGDAIGGNGFGGDGGFAQGGNAIGGNAYAGR
ncbi:hypothetical protein M3Y99_01517400 [Aphelenchoides fujianensis]|nr:hypothetical protein M3Y99_01517400 [Aphelenchoides fujianensis]